MPPVAIAGAIAPSMMTAVGRLRTILTQVALAGIALILVWIGYAGSTATSDDPSEPTTAIFGCSHWVALTVLSAG